MINVPIYIEDFIKFLTDDDIPVFYRYLAYIRINELIERSKLNEQRTKKNNAT